MAAVTAPGRTAAQHQSLLHFVGNAAWSDEKVLAKTRDMVLPAIERQGPIEAWIIDDTGFPKKGEHSVGVTRQYCGQLGVAVFSQSPREPAGGLPSVSAGRLGSGQQTSAQDGRA
jgi:SRSO17 transposase